MLGGIVTKAPPVILQCSAINENDLSALESLETINERLREMNVKLHLSEVKGRHCQTKPA